ncbi:hypothetical protein [Desulfotignum balticum]|uniref:hypothetical protein n=1 Tax=Desulfotignum balticum TaxID=115781 RepID=UPI0012EB8BF7|nr:hypothetical protein [Desulfotignum balticum]
MQKLNSTLNAIMKIEISAKDRTDLMGKLAAIDISVPPRTQGRTKDHCERWSICRWLSTYPYFHFSIKLTHRDRPDFLLETSDSEIGIEHTEAIPEDYAHASAISERIDNDILPDISHFKWGQKKKKDEIYKIANMMELTGPGWKGDTPEIEWAQAVFEIIQKKTNLLKKHEFQKYDENILLIYDNLSLPFIDHSKAKATSILRESLKSYWNDGLLFNKIFVQTDDLLIFFSQNKINTFEVNNVW